MKKRDFFRQLEQDLDAAAPAMSDRLKEQPIRTARTPAQAKENSAKTSSPLPAAKTPVRRFPRRFTAIAACAAAVVLCAFAAVPLFKAFFPAGETAACLYIDINPSLALTLDENYKVRKAVSRNADGDTLTENDEFSESLIGLSAADAAVKVAEQAARSGYFDFFDKGNETEYNEMSVTLKSSEGSETALSGIRDSLVDYFCDEGIYVYVNAAEESDPDAGETRKALESRPASYVEWVADTQSAEEMTLLTEETAYRYASDLLKDALRKYDLFRSIDDLNARIREDPDNPLGLSYWTINRDLNDNVRTLCAETERQLEALYLLYGVDGRSSYLAYSAAKTAYDASVLLADVDALRELDKAGINAQTFGGIGNLSVRVNYFYFVSNDILYDLVTDIWNGAVATVEELLSDLGSLIADRAETLLERYSAVFALPRESIGATEYDDFLQRIGK